MIHSRTQIAVISVWFGTATAACPGVHLRNSVHGPDQSDLPRLAAAAVADLASCLAMFTTEVNRFVPARHLWGTVRVPTDVLHDVQTGVTWLPQSLRGYNISETGGMMTAIQATLWAPLCQPARVAHTR